MTRVSTTQRASPGVKVRLRFVNIARQPAKERQSRYSRAFLLQVLPASSIALSTTSGTGSAHRKRCATQRHDFGLRWITVRIFSCLLYTSDAADDLLCVALGG